MNRSVILTIHSVPGHSHAPETGKTMKVCELFASIQGESTLQGLPTVFIRLSGCNLDCCYCDTRYARSGGTDMSVGNLIGAIAKYAIHYVCITGGEPLLDKDMPVLAERLIAGGYTVSVETNGTIDASVLPEEAVRIIDIKCPGSGEDGKTHPGNLKDIRQSDEYKFVVTDREDFDYACDVINKNNLLTAHAVLFSPVTDILPASILADWIVHEMPDARLQLQLHKIIWPGDIRGR